MGSSDWNRGRHLVSRPPDFTEIKERPLGINRAEYPSVCDFSRSLNRSAPSSLKSSPKSHKRHSSGILGLEPSKIVYASTSSKLLDSGTATTNRWRDELDYSSPWCNSDLEQVRHYASRHKQYPHPPANHPPHHSTPALAPPSPLALHTEGGPAVHSFISG
jgi:hypothetical protein